jgi:hypothetical protein
MAKYSNTAKAILAAIPPLPRLGDKIKINFGGREREGVICYLSRRGGAVRLLGEETVVPLHDLVSFKPWRGPRQGVSQ